MSRILQAIVPSRRRQSPATAILIILAMVALFIGATFHHFLEYQKENEVYKEELNRLRQARRALGEWEEKRQVLLTSDFEKERKARQLQMVRDNETVIYLEPEGAAAEE